MRELRLLGSHKHLQEVKVTKKLKLSILTKWQKKEGQASVLDDQIERVIGT